MSVIFKKEVSKAWKESHGRNFQFTINNYFLDRLLSKNIDQKWLTTGFECEK